MPKRVSVLTRNRTLLTGPPVRTVAQAENGIAQVAVHAIAVFGAVFSVSPFRTPLRTPFSHPTGTTIAPAGGVIALAAVQAQTASVQTAVAVRTGLALELAFPTAPARWTVTASGGRVTQRAVFASARLSASRPKRARQTHYVTPFSDPSVPTPAPPVKSVALAAISAVARLGAVHPESVRHTRFVAPLSHPTGRALASAV